MKPTKVYYAALIIKVATLFAILNLVKGNLLVSILGLILVIADIVEKTQINPHYKEKFNEYKKFYIILITAALLIGLVFVIIPLI